MSNHDLVRQRFEGEGDMWRTWGGPIAVSSSEIKPMNMKFVFQEKGKRLQVCHKSVWNGVKIELVNI
jgi:hypothetical protein